MKFQCNRMADVCVIKVDENRIDAAGAIDFKEGIRTQLNEWAGRVVLDLSDVEFIDSSGLGAIVAVRKLLGGGRALELAALSPNVEKVFRLTRMDSIFPIHPSLSGLQRDAV